MKDSLLPSVRIEGSLRADAERLLREGETLTSFIEDSVRRAVIARLEEAEFNARCDRALAQYQRGGKTAGIDEVFDRLKKRLNDRALQRFGRRAAE